MSDGIASTEEYVWYKTSSGGWWKMNTFLTIIFSFEMKNYDIIEESTRGAAYKRIILDFDSDWLVVSWSCQHYMQELIFVGEGVRQWNFPPHVGDDTLLLLKLDRAAMINIRCVLLYFQAVLVLIVNWTKSELVPLDSGFSSDEYIEISRCKINKVVGN